tara:strand:+ start:150 stop:1160 length:1011 start_codon:yes stop_codon:yes gene_type:complete
MNIKEFSKKIGVPISTISKALGGYKDVNINTKNNIVALAKKYNYVPNIYAKTLASKVNFSVGLVLPFTYSHEQKITLIDFIENVHSKLNALNIPVIMIFAKDAQEEIDAFEKLINYHKVRLILLNDTKKIDERIEYLDNKKMSYITWGRCNKDPNEYSWIDEDILYSNNLAINFILSKGHSKIGYVDSDLKSNYISLRKKYFKASLKKNNIEINESYFVKGYRDNQIKTKENIKQLLLNNNEITILLISSHTLASYVVEACREMNKKIGKDISLISFDSNILSSIAPFMSVVGQPVKEINKNFIRLIQAKINKLNKNFHYLYKSKLFDNGSVAKIK